MTRTHLDRLALAIAMIASPSLGACPSEPTPEGNGTTTEAMETTDGGSTATPDPSTATTGSDTTAALDETGTAGHVDPTGQAPPSVDCGAGGTLPGPVTITTDEDVAQLDGIAVIDGDLVVTGTSYSNLDFLSCLTEVRGDIEITGNDLLIDLGGTDNITALGRLPINVPTPSNPNEWDDGRGSISITNNEALWEVNGFGGLTEIGQQGRAGDCPGAPAGLQCIAFKSLLVRHNAAATSISGFGALSLIYGSLVIQENDSLRDLDGFASLVGIGTTLIVTNNPMLCTSAVNALGNNLNYLGDMAGSSTANNDDSC